jgi:signal transduction histidine kinase/DNA-binding response OmpR family regulator
MPKRILIADNDVLLSALVREALERVGYQVAVVGDGLEAWSKIQEGAPDFLILDLVMPRLDGARLCRHLKADPRFHSLPVIVLTGTPISGDSDMEALGAEAYIAKRASGAMVEDLLGTLQALERGERPTRAPKDYRSDGDRPRQLVLELLAETAHLSAILENLGEGVLLVDPAGRLTHVNPAGAELLQRPQRELLGAELIAVLGAEPGDPLEKALHQLTSQGGLEPVRLQYSYRDRMLHLTLTNLLEGGQLAGYLLLAREVTPLFRRIHELTALNELANLFTSTLKLDEVLRRVMERIQALMQVEAGSLLLKDPETDELVFQIAVGPQKDAVQGRRLNAGVGITGWVFQAGVPVIVPDVQQDPRFYRGVDATTGFVTRSMLCVPLKVRDKVIGVIEVLNTIANPPFSGEDLNLLSAIAAHGATAIENAVLYEESGKRNRALRDLLETSREFGSTLHLEVLLSMIVRKTLEIAPAARSGIMLLDEESRYGYVQASTAHGRTLRANPRLDLARYPEIRKVIESRQPVIVVDALEDPLMQSVREFIEPIGLRSVLAVPLVSQGQVIGVLDMAHYDEIKRFTADEVDLCQILANHASVAIENARLYGQVTRHATELEQKVRARTQELLMANARLEDASRHKSEFLANMSHEIRTPLNAVIGFSEILRELRVGPLTERQSRYVSNIWQSGKHLLQVINDILDLSKVEAGKLTMAAEALPVVMILEDILTIARVLAHKKDQMVEADVEPRLPPLRADPVRLKQILFNLLNNAVKFTPDGGRITLTARRVAGSGGQPADVSKPMDRMMIPPIDGPNEWLEIKVQDTGVGIRPEDLPRLFQEFTQLESTQDQRHEGAGLGLALTRRLVDMHGGRIWAESEGAGKGSTFTVRLPFDGPGA